MERDKESGDRHVSPLPLSSRRQQWVCVMARFPFAFFVQVMNDILTPCHPTWPYYQWISCYSLDRSTSRPFYFSSSQNILQTSPHAEYRNLAECVCLNIGKLTHVILICLFPAKFRSPQVRHTFSTGNNVYSTNTCEQVCLCITSVTV